MQLEFEPEATRQQSPGPSTAPPVAHSWGGRWGHCFHPRVAWVESPGPCSLTLFFLLHLLPLLRARLLTKCS